MLPPVLLRLAQTAFLLYCGLRSFKAIRSVDPNDDRRWLTFWLLFTLFEFATTISDYTLGMVLPLYDEAKLAFVVFLGVGGGASLLFPVLEPLLLEAEKRADDAAAQARRELEKRRA